jgi:hypothetical protein
MKVGVRPVVMGVATKPDATANSPRCLLLFSALMVMVFSRGAHPLISVVALLLAAVATGVALLHPGAEREGNWQRRAEWVLVLSLLLTGLFLTAALLARAFAALGSPAWEAMVAVYTIFGLAGALLLFRRSPRMKWAFALFLLVHTVITVAFLRSSPAQIDVEVFLRDGAIAVLHGHNPYAMTFPDIYPPKLTEQFYGHGVVINGRVTYGFPYLPAILLVSVPAQLLGDVRYGQLIAMLVTALILRRLATDRVGRAAAVLGVAAPTAIPVLTLAWTEPTLVALLACLVLALERRRYAIAAAFLGLFLVSKQYVVIVIPLVWLIRHWLTRRTILIGLGLGAAVTLPFLVVDPSGFWKAIVEFQLIQPFRSDSVSMLVSSVNTFGWPPPWTYSVLPLAGGGLTALALARRAPRTPAAFAAAVGLTLLVTILLSKEAFMNYYYLVSGAFLIAAVTWPTQQPLTGTRTAKTSNHSHEDPRDRDHYELSVGGAHGDHDDEPADHHDRTEHGPEVGFFVEN